MPEEGKPQPANKIGAVGCLLLVFFGLFAAVSLLAFLKLLYKGGWSSASQKHPAGALLLFVAFAITYVLAIVVIQKKHKTAARAMILAAVVAVGGLFVATLFPSCQDDGREPTDIYYRR